MKPTIYIHHDAYSLTGYHLHTVSEQHRSEGYPRSEFGWFCFYQYFIERDGLTVQARPDFDPSVEYKQAHQNSISICLAGNHDMQDPTEEQKYALFELLDRLCITYNIDARNIKEHRDYQATSCPGSRIPRGYFARLYIAGKLKGVDKLVQQLKISVLQFMERQHAKQ